MRASTAAATAEGVDVEGGVEGHVQGAHHHFGDGPGGCRGSQGAAAAAGSGGGQRRRAVAEEELQLLLLPGGGSAPQHRPELALRAHTSKRRWLASVMPHVLSSPLRLPWVVCMLRMWGCLGVGCKPLNVAVPRVAVVVVVAVPCWYLYLHPSSSRLAPI